MVPHLPKSTRRVILALLSLVFIALGAFVLLYAQGYRLDVQKLSLTRVGAIYVRSLPGDATVSIREKGTEEHSGLFERGVFVEGLFPGRYTITVKKEGYRTLTRTLPVEPAQVAEAKYVVLVPEIPVPEEHISPVLPKEVPKDAHIEEAFGDTFGVASSGIFLINTKKETAQKIITPPRNTTIGTVRIAERSILWATAGASSSIFEYDSFSATSTPLGTSSAAVKDIQGASPRWYVLDTAGTVTVYEKGTKKEEATRITLMAVHGASLALAGLKGLEVTGPDDAHWRFNRADLEATTELIWYRDERHLFLVEQNKALFFDLDDTLQEDVPVIAEGTNFSYDEDKNTLSFTKEQVRYHLVFPK
jgi:hypothetical protein